MMSSAATSSPLSASTLAYLMRWPVLRLTWLKETFSVSEVAGYKATGQVTSERRRKPFQLARGAMKYSENATDDIDDTTGNRDFEHAGRRNLLTALTAMDSIRSVAPGQPWLRRFGRGWTRNGRPGRGNIASGQALPSTGGVGALAGITATYGMRLSWLHIDTARLSKPRPRRGRANPARPCSRCGRLQPASRY